jgi:hypothetical protein
MTLVLTIFGSLCGAAIAAVLAHRLTSQRDQANRRSDMRIQHLLSAYRTLTDRAEREAPTTAAEARDFEQSLADIQLLGSSEQVKMVLEMALAMEAEGTGSVDDLLMSLRDDLRKELRLEPMDGGLVNVRVVGSDGKEIGSA